MRKITLESVKDCSTMYQNGEYVVCFGENLRIFRVDGTYVARKKNIRWPYKVVFLPENRALVQGSKNYHYISLVDGADLWECSRPYMHMIPPGRFAVSPDRKLLYDSYYDKNYKPYVICINPEGQTYNCFSVEKGLLELEHTFCDENGILCGFESQGLENRVLQMGIREMTPNSETKGVVWRHSWIQSATPRAIYTNGKYILNTDLTVMNIDTKEIFSLFENKGDWNPVGGINNWTYDSERDLLTACDYQRYENLVIDCKKRQMVARYSGYFGDTWEKWRVGCLVGDEFWIGTPDGIVRKPFPLIEEMPEYKKPSRSLNLW